MPSTVEEVKDLFGDLGLHRYDPPVIQDPEPRSQDLSKEDIEGVFLPGESDLLRESLNAGTEDPMPSIDRLDPDSEREVSFAGTRLSEKECNLIVVDKS